MPMDRNSEYDIYKALQRIENELIQSMMRNFDRHRAEEEKEGMNWTAWQAEQLKALEQYKRRNLKAYKGKFGKLNADIESMIRLMRQTGRASQEIGILEALKKGYKIQKELKKATTEGRFFKVNDRKLNALIKATVDDMEKAEQAVLRMANDKYRKAIFAAEVYANTGAGTYEKAVDMATRDMLSAGLNCVEYKNGARHTLSNYARMAIKTANKKAYLMGEGEKRAEWGVHTVIVKKRGNACPYCLPFVGKVLIDDVYSGGSKGDGEYPLLSDAMAAKFLHPNCKDIYTTYFPGISTPPSDQKLTGEDVKKAKEDYTNEQKQNYCKNNAERFRRMSENSLDEDNKRKYAARAKEWEEKYTGLSSGKEKDSGSEYKAPKILQKIDKTDYKDIKSILEGYEKTIVNDVVENAIVVTKNGNVYQCFGTENKVFPDKDLGDILIGASVTHNHPANVTEYSFSKDDLELFENYSLTTLRGCDEKYVYEITRENDIVDECPTLFDMTDEDYLHFQAIQFARQNGYGYRRVKR